MRNISIFFSVSLENFRKWPANPRIYILFLTLIMIINLYTSPFLDASNSLEIPITPWIYPYLTCNPYFLLFSMLGIVLLFCDAPFFDNTQPYVLVRCGKKKWIKGQILYIIGASAVYFLIAILLSILFLSSNMQWSSEWGKVFGTLAQTDIESIAQVPYKVQFLYSPIQAMAMSFLFSWMIGVFLGIVIFAVNMNFNRAWGSVLASAFIVMVVFARNAPFIVTYFSPVSWASLDIIDPTDATKYPSVLFAGITLCVMIIILSILASKSFKRKNIVFLPSI